MRKRVIAVICSCVVMIGCLSACGSNTESSSAPESDNLQIVTTIFPIYDWVREILGENPAGIELTMLMDNGVDLHSFQPSASDILKISTCDVSPGRRLSIGCATKSTKLPIRIRLNKTDRMTMAFIFLLFFLRAISRAT